MMYIKDINPKYYKHLKEAGQHSHFGQIKNGMVSGKLHNLVKQENPKIYMNLNFNPAFSILNVFSPKNYERNDPLWIRPV